MTALGIPVAVRPEEVVASRPARRLEPLDLLLPAAWALWGYGVVHADLARAYGVNGLLSALPLAFYAGLVVLVVSSAAQLVRRPISDWRMGLHLVSLIFMVQGTVPILYGANAPRYYWQYKTIGETQFMASHGGLSYNLDIYQHWPGFNGLGAFFDSIAGIHSPNVTAAWSQPFFDVVLAGVFAFAISSLDMTKRQRWLAVLLFWAGDWVATSGQDDYAPQTIGLVLSFIALGIVLRSFTRRDKMATAPPRRLRKLSGAIAALVVVDLGMLVTHPLSPYVVVLQLVALTVVVGLRPRVVVFAIGWLAAMYLAINFNYLNTTYGVIKGILSGISGNIGTPSAGGSTRVGDTHYFIILVTALLVVLAFVGGVRRFRARREWLTMAVLAVSPCLLVGLVHYGAETSYRVLLFALPWFAVLATFALWPEGVPAVPLPRRRQHVSSPARPVRARRVVPHLPRLPLPLEDSLRGARAILLGAVLLVAVLGSVDIDYSQMALYAVSPTTVKVADQFYADAPRGVALFVDEYFPIDAGGRYPQFLAKDEYVPVLDQANFTGDNLATKLAAITNLACAYETPSQPRSYLVISTEMARASDTAGIYVKGSVNALWNELRHSKEWAAVYQDKTAAVYLNVSGCPGFGSVG